jgi:hypothetical protein
MRYSLRLAELLGHVPDPRKRPGTIKAICEYTGLDRHQVASLLRNEVKYIPLKALSRLCDYLIEHGHIPADQLPGALFAIEPENFWELLARRRRLEMCIGVRRPDQTGWPEGAWVAASDSVLLGELLNGVSTLGGTAKHRRAPSVQGDGVLAGAIPLGSAPLGSAPHGPTPHPEHLTQSLVWSPGQGPDQEVKSRAEQVYHEFDEWRSDKALVCLGSMKSNPVLELVIARAFQCEPFQSQDHLSAPGLRRCPFFLRFRDFDPHPESCCGGMQLAASHPAAQPGLYFENADGSWSCCPWEEGTRDAALVFYLHRESQGWLEMALGGFSGRATRLLAKTLQTRAEDFWPPIYTGHGIQVGAFIVQYTFDPQDRSQDILRTDLVAGTHVIRLDGQTIERRLSGGAELAKAAEPMTEA